MHQDLFAIYQSYLACLNAQDWESVGTFVYAEVSRNGDALGLAGYRDMLIKDHEAIPDLRFVPVFTVCDQAALGAVLKYDCHPIGKFMRLPINGRRVVFHENIFHEFRNTKYSVCAPLSTRPASSNSLPPEASLGGSLRVLPDPR